jgi:hypothetical protein
VGRPDRGLGHPAELLLEHPAYRLFGPAYPPAGNPDHYPGDQERVRARLERAAARAPDYLLTGRSWSGNGPVIRPRSAPTAGAAGTRPSPADRVAPAAWQRWEFPWRTPGPGSHTLRARATDVTGITQPAAVTANTFGYLFDGIVRHPVTTP